MTPPRLIRLAHTAPYSWFAKGNDIAGMQALGDTEVPILRVRQGENFEPRTGLYLDTIEKSRAVDRPDWWLKPGSEMERWRAGIASGAQIALRLFKEDGTPNGTTGRWLGVYRVVESNLSDVEIRVQLNPKRERSIRQ